MACRNSAASARKLFDVFIAPYTFTPSSALHPSTRCTHHPLQARTYAAYRGKRRIEPVKEVTPFNDPAKPVDEMIDGAVVKLIDENNKLTSVKFDHLLARIDRSKEVVRQMTSDNESPIVKVVPKSELLEEMKVKQILSKKKPAAKKELELSWTIDRKNDLAYRLKKVESWLEEGRQVEITIGQRRQNRRAEKAECTDLLERLRAILDKVKGASETAFLGRIGGQVLLTFAGPEDESIGAAESIKQIRSEKKAQKQQEKEERRAEAKAKVQRRAERDEQYKEMRAQQQAA